jgi:HEAT repeat protein
MKTPTGVLVPVLVGVLLWCGSPSMARSVDERMTGFGSMIRASDLVAIGTLEDARLPRTPRGFALRLRVESVIAGSGDRTDAVVRTARRLPPASLAGRVLVFLVALPEQEDDEFRLSLDAFSIVRLPAAGDRSDVLDFVRRQASLIIDDEPGFDARAFLVTGAVAKEPRVGLSALLELLADEALAETLDASDRATLLKRFGTLRPHDARRRCLVELLGMVRAKAAALPLVNALADEDARPLRATIGAALRRLDDDGAAKRLLALRADGIPKRRADVASVLGRWGRSAFRVPLEGMLMDGDAGVREEAVLALGRMADDASFTALRDALERAKTFPMRRAIVWALGRLDCPEGFALVRSVARSDPEERLRRVAERVLKTPKAGYTVK